MSVKSEKVGSPDGVQSRLPSLTGMRFLAAVMVFLFHGVLYAGLFAAPDAQSTLGAVVAGGGWAGVTFFFVLSGFVLAWSSRSSDTSARFWRRRLFKIFPNHLLATVAAFILLVTVMGASLSSGPVTLNVLLLHSWVPDFQVLFAGNVVSWTLSCELLFYLAFPLLMPLINRIRPERLWHWAGALVLAVWLVPSVAAAITPAQALSAPTLLPVLDMTMWNQWFVALFPPARLFEFLFGMVLARVVMTGGRLPVSLGGAVAIAIGAYALTPLFPGEYRVAATMVLPLGLVIAAGAQADIAGQAGWLSRRTMVFLGDVSFAFYVCHWLVIDYGHRLLGTGSTFSTSIALLVLAGLFAASVAIASAMYLFMEKPVMDNFAVSKKHRKRTGKLAAVGSPPTTGSAPDTSAPDRIAG